MKYVFLFDLIVREIIPEYDPAFPDIPIEQRYTPEFLAQCIPVNEDLDVQIGDTYDPISGEFIRPEISSEDEPDTPDGETPEEEEVDDDNSD